MKDILEAASSMICEAKETIENLSNEEKEKIGNVAMELVGDYPLYGAMSNITYEEAILIALAIDSEVLMENLDDVEEE